MLDLLLDVLCVFCVFDLHCGWEVVFNICLAILQAPVAFCNALVTAVAIIDSFLVWAKSHPEPPRDPFPVDLKIRQEVEDAKAKRAAAAEQQTRLLAVSKKEAADRTRKVEATRVRKEQERQKNLKIYEEQIQYEATLRPTKVSKPQLPYDLEEDLANQARLSQALRQPETILPPASRFTISTTQADSWAQQLSAETGMVLEHAYDCLRSNHYDILEARINFQQVCHLLTPDHFIPNFFHESPTVPAVSDRQCKEMVLHFSKITDLKLDYAEKALHAHGYDLDATCRKFEDVRHELTPDMFLGNFKAMALHFSEVTDLKLEYAEQALRAHGYDLDATCRQFGDVRHELSPDLFIGNFTADGVVNTLESNAPVPEITSFEVPTVTVSTPSPVQTAPPPAAFSATAVPITPTPITTTLPTTDQSVALSHSNAPTTSLPPANSGVPPTAQSSNTTSTTMPLSGPPGNLHTLASAQTKVNWSSNPWGRNNKRVAGNQIMEPRTNELEMNGDVRRPISQQKLTIKIWMDNIFNRWDGFKSDRPEAIFQSGCKFGMELEDEAKLLHHRMHCIIWTLTDDAGNVKPNLINSQELMQNYKFCSTKFVNLFEQLQDAIDTDCCKDASGYMKTVYNMLPPEWRNGQIA